MSDTKKPVKKGLTEREARTLIRLLEKMDVEGMGALANFTFHRLVTLLKEAA